jgi:hypothetical protein
MSDGIKRIEASILRSSTVGEEANLHHRTADGRTGHDTSATEDGREGRGFQPVGSAHRERMRVPRRFEMLLQFKGFGGGVPPNTERTTVKPWVGIAR